MKVILDTNVIVSAFAARGICSEVFEICLKFHEMIISKYIMSELSRVLMAKFRMPEIKVDEIITYVSEHSLFGFEDDKAKVHCRDKNDIKILKLAVGSMADFLVTGDEDLLVLKKTNKTLIISPRQFWLMQSK